MFVFMLCLKSTDYSSPDTSALRVTAAHFSDTTISRKWAIGFCHWGRPFGVGLGEPLATVARGWCPALAGLQCVNRAFADR